MPTAPLVKKDANVKHSSELVICVTEHKLKKDERVSPKTDKKQGKGQQVPKMKISRNLITKWLPTLGFRFTFDPKKPKDPEQGKNLSALGFPQLVPLSLASHHPHMSTYIGAKLAGFFFIQLSIQRSAERKKFSWAGASRAIQRLLND